jgi:hypothetical protein
MEKEFKREEKRSSKKGGKTGSVKKGGEAAPPVDMSAFDVVVPDLALPEPSFLFAKVAAPPASSMLFAKRPGVAVDDDESEGDDE